MTKKLIEVKTAEAFHASFREGFRGSRIIYHKGFLAVDREKSKDTELKFARLIGFIQVLVNLRLCKLYQVRVEESLYEYGVVKLVDVSLDASHVAVKFDRRVAIQEWYIEAKTALLRR